MMPACRLREWWRDLIRAPGWRFSFAELNREGRDRMLKILEFVQKTTTFYNNRYLNSLTKS